ncbi:MAG: type I DNA topoisomerase, partial [bacterium]
MAKNLVVVESPAKVKTIGKYLGKDFIIKASMGHIIDLPDREFGIDLENSFKPTFVVLKGKGKVIKELKSAGSKADAVYLAQDPDREGEAIAWHVAQLFNKKKKIYRISFNEITRTAVREAVSNPGEIDQKKVNAQQARRILDRIVGYKVSPFLWKAVHKGLSAGRVQSVALRLICERDEEINVFKPEEYWTLDIQLLTKNNESFIAKLVKIQDQNAKIPDKQSIDKVMEELDGAGYSVTSIQKKQKRRMPYLPFITSTLQQDAARKLHFSASKTMYIAQQLYEGLDINNESIGLITYMRTDSTRIAQQAREHAVQYIKKNFGADYIGQERVALKSAAVQDAHEAIRPSQIELDYEPDKLKSFLTADQLKLYTLIWRRFIASQMSPMLFDQTNVDILVDKYLFRTVGSILRFKGFSIVYSGNDLDGEGSDKDDLLPDLKEGESLGFEKYIPAQHFTQPPPRYSEALLIKELEKQGIGRPSTYAQIIDTLKQRKYVHSENRRFNPSELGKTINKILISQFPIIFDVKFT